MKANVCLCNDNHVQCYLLETTERDLSALTLRWCSGSAILKEWSDKRGLLGQSIGPHENKTKLNEIENNIQYTRWKSDTNIFYIHVICTTTWTFHPSIIMQQLKQACMSKNASAEYLKKEKKEAILSTQFIFEPAKTTTGDRMHLNKIQLVFTGTKERGSSLLFPLRVCGDETCISVIIFFVVVVVLGKPFLL